MTNNDQQLKLTSRGIIVGICIGALLGAILRFLVAILFLYFVKAKGLWWGEAISDEEYQATAVSAILGLLVGGTSGATCRPILGTVIGGTLSGTFCLGMFAIPVGACIGISEGIVNREQLQLQVILGLIGMTIAGALAGGAGASFGRYWCRS
jgi:hypothetical protein